MAETSAQRGLTVDQVNNTRSITAQTGFTESTKGYLSEQERAAMLINKVLAELKGACPGWRSSIATKEDYDSMRQQWLIGFLENGITSDYQIESGMSKARTYNKPFLPSVGQFIEWCKKATETQWPPLEAAFAELQSMLAQNRKDWHECTPLLQHIVLRTLDLYNYKQVYKDYERIKLFEIAYKAALFQIESGEDLKSYPHPKTLLESDTQKQASPDVVEKTAAIRSSLLRMFEDPPKNPLTKAEIDDLEKLGRLQNE